MTSEPMVEACFDGNFGGGLEKWENWRSFSSFDRRWGIEEPKAFRWFILCYTIRASARNWTLMFCICGNMWSFYSLVPHLVEAKHSLKKEVMEDTVVWNRLYNLFLLLWDNIDMSQSAFTCISTFIPYENKVTWIMF